MSDGEPSSTKKNFQVSNSGLLNLKENIMHKIKKCFLILILLILSPYVLAASDVKKWQDTQLVIVELSEELKPVDKKAISLDKPFNANNENFKIEFDNLSNDKNAERKLNIQSENSSVIQKFTTPEQALNWATQMKLNNGKTYYFMIIKLENKR